MESPLKNIPPSFSKATSAATRSRSEVIWVEKSMDFPSSIFNWINCLINCRRATGSNGSNGNYKKNRHGGLG